MSSLHELNQALRRQTSHGLWLSAQPANLNRPRAGLVGTLVRAMKRRHTANLLKRLDSRLLDDIGIIRGEIDEIAANAAAEAGVREGTPTMDRIASLAKLPASILTGLNNAWRRQAAIVALKRLPDHTLADIGIERGRIAETVDLMIARGEATAAPVRVESAARPTPAPTPATTPAPVPVAKADTAPARKAA
jgi:uncharacterized protein YjiS (DUF1127 family)